MQEATGDHDERNGVADGEAARSTGDAALIASIHDIERWFVRRGVPHYIERYDASTKVWTRAAPFLVVFTVAIAILAVVVEPSVDVIVDAAAAVVSPLVIWVVGNVARRRKPFTRPRRLGIADLIGWVALDTLPEVVRANWSVVPILMALDALLLGVVYLVTSYGIVPLATWGARRLVSSLASVRTAAARALPMLLLFVSFFFLTAETWQTFAHLEGPAYGVSLLLFVAVGVSFVWSSLRPDIDEMGRFDTWDDVRAVLDPADSPALRLPVAPTDAPSVVDLTRRQRINSLLLAVGNQTILAVLVAAVLGAFFLVFGFLVADEALIKAWVPGTEPHVYWALTVSGRRLVLTEELIRVSGFLATFSGFYFGVYSVTDPSFRQGLRDDSSESLRQAMAARLLYLEARRVLASNRR